MTNFYKFALKIETSITKGVIKPISKTGNSIDVIVYVWFIYWFSVKKIKTCIVKKNNSKLE